MVVPLIIGGPCGAFPLVLNKRGQYSIYLNYSISAGCGYHSMSRPALFLRNMVLPACSRGYPALLFIGVCVCVCVESSPTKNGLLGALMPSCTRSRHGFFYDATFLSLSTCVEGIPSSVRADVSVICSGSLSSLTPTISGASEKAIPVAPPYLQGCVKFLTWC